MPELTDLEHVLFGLANLSPDRLKYAARALDFLLSLESTEKLPFDQVISNYRLISIYSKYQQHYLTPGEYDRLKSQYIKESVTIEKVTPTIAPVQPAAHTHHEPVKTLQIVKKHYCGSCGKAEDIDGKNSYCPETGKVYNNTEYHECRLFQIEQKPVKPTTKKEKKIPDAAEEYEPSIEELKAKATYDRYYKPKPYAWQKRNTDLVDSRAMHDCSLTRRENNQIIRDMGKTEYCKDAYHY
jgi:hypothetical protein